MPLPSSDPSQEKAYAPKISAIVDEISKLNLLEVADLNELLKVLHEIDSIMFKFH